MGSVTKHCFNFLNACSCTSPQYHAQALPNKSLNDFDIVARWFVNLIC